ncbi:cell division protein ZipA C-terminal FtsZ-binding domain-containing protein, partial [Pasteurella canis]
VGIALFMQLPSEGNDLMNLRMMIRAAKSIAEELEGFVLTDKQEIFDEQAEKAYLARVK